MAVHARRQPPSPLAGVLGRARVDWVSALGLVLVALLAVWLAINFVKDPAAFVTFFLIGLTNGALYALIALGYTLVYGILELINFAHGDLFAVMGLLGSTFIVGIFGLREATAALGIIAGIAAALLLVMAIAALVNITIEFVAYRRLRHAPRLAPLISAIGMSFILQTIGLWQWGVGYRGVENLLPNRNVFDVGGVEYSWDKLFVVLLTIPLLLVLTWLVKATRQGKAMRATAQDRDAAAMMGIDVNRTISFTFALAGALAGAAGVLYLLFQTQIRYDTGFELGLIAFTAAVLGGIGNLTGAVVGALVIGLIQAFNEGLPWYAPGSDWTRSIVFGILIAILVFRPQGFLGERTPEGA